MDGFEGDMWGGSLLDGRIIRPSHFNGIYLLNMVRVVTGWKECDDIYISGWEKS